MDFYIEKYRSIKSMVTAVTGFYHNLRYKYGLLSGWNKYIVEQKVVIRFFISNIINEYYEITMD